MIRIILICAVFIFSACTQAPHIYRSSGNYSIAGKINNAIAESGLSTNMGIMVKSLKTGKTLYEMNASSLFNPASNLKFIPAIATLSLIDTGFKFKTEVYQNQKNIYLVGSGDPDLSLSSLDSLASIVSGVSADIDTLFLDATRFDSISWGPGWMWDEGPWWYAAPIGALSLNDNCVDFFIEPGLPGEAALISYSPKTAYIEIKNSTSTVMDTNNFIEFNLDRDWKNRNNQFTASGNVLTTAAPDTIFRNIEDPTHFTGTVFREMLKSKGTKIKAIALKEKPSEGKLIAEHDSEPLIVILKNLMMKSDNLTAEILVKNIGSRSTSGKQGSWTLGLTAIKEFLYDQVSIDTTTLNLADGSGVSRYNYLSPQHFIDLLTWAYNNEKIRDDLLSTLPVSGDNEYLRGTAAENQGSKILFKTGGLAGVKTLSGYIFTKGGEPLAFSILMNGFTGYSGPYRNLQDDITQILVNME